MSIILSDAGWHAHLLPLTFTRPVGQLRPGILRLAEGWYVRSGLGVGYRTENYLSAAFPLPIEPAQFEVDGALFPTDAIVGAVMDLRPGQVLVQDGVALAFGSEGKGHPSIADWRSPPVHLTPVPFTDEVIRFERPWHVFQHCGKAIAHDFQLLTEGRRSERLEHIGSGKFPVNGTRSPSAGNSFSATSVGLLWTSLGYFPGRVPLNPCSIPVVVSTGCTS